VKRLALAVALLATAAAARKPRAASGPSLPASRFFASRPGLVRVYEGRVAHRREDDAPAAGASCEVLESRKALLRESCTMIVGRKARPATEITYELRESGIYSVQAKTEGSDQPLSMERLVLPNPLRVGTSWKEARGDAQLVRTVTSAGRPCKAAGRSFADCLVLAVTQSNRKRLTRRYTETWAAGVGLVEDAQWELIDVKGL